MQRTTVFCCLYSTVAGSGGAVKRQRSRKYSQSRECYITKGGQGSFLGRRSSGCTPSSRASCTHNSEAGFQRLHMTYAPGSCSSTKNSQDQPSFADDMVVDEEGNAYVTDAGSTRIWKLTPDGSQSLVLTDSPDFKVSGPLPFEIVSLNGIAYHPDIYLLVGHSSAGALFKVSLDGASVHRVTVTGNIFMADGIALLAPDKLVVVSALGTKLVATFDGWETAKVTHKHSGPLHRFGTSVFVKDSTPYTSFGLGFGIREFSSTIREAVF